MMIAITPSLNASNRPLFIYSPCPNFGQVRMKVLLVTRSKQ
jgi:hypothetical protein